MLKNELAIGLGVAIVTGAIIAVQVAYLGRSAASLGAIRSGMLTTLTGALLGIVALVIMLSRGDMSWQFDRSTWIALFLGGVLGSVALIGISYSSQHVGVTAALATVLLGQMLISVIIDARGFGTLTIPFSIERLIGLALLGGGVYLLLFRN
jgi:bacterial/archaeal transporter family-2 protein